MSSGASATGSATCCLRNGLWFDGGGGRKRALGTRAPMPVHQFIDGRRLRILVVVDDCTRECLALIADGIRAARELDRLLEDNGTGQQN
jgi:hypothetical protein